MESYNNEDPATILVTFMAVSIFAIVMMICAVDYMGVDEPLNSTNDVVSEPLPTPAEEDEQEEEQEDEQEEEQEDEQEQKEVEKEDYSDMPPLEVDGTFSENLTDEEDRVIGQKVNRLFNHTFNEILKVRLQREKRRKID